VLTYDREAAVAHLRRADPILARVIDSVGPFTMEPRDGSFRSLARAIFFQQLAGPAARAIMGRVLQRLGTDEERFYRPEQLLAVPAEDLRVAGLSRQKLVYLRDLSEKFAGGQLTEDEFWELEDEEVIERVCVVKGIGRWTAEMFLIFSLGRPDVLPVEDRRTVGALSERGHVVHVAQPGRRAARGGPVGEGNSVTGDAPIEYHVRCVRIGGRHEQ
jgi:3-methyladenine DNA glycosylase/8-oxoguanine DNA glycosylase